MAQVALVAVATVTGGMLVTLIHEPADSPAMSNQTAPQPVSMKTAPAASGPIQLVGQVVAISPDWLTTRTADGKLATFRLTPATTQISAPGENHIGEPEFGVNETVVVVGTVEHGTRVATAVAHNEVTGPNGPPMDSDLPA